MVAPLLALQPYGDLTILLLYHTHTPWDKYTSLDWARLYDVEHR